MRRAFEDTSTLPQGKRLKEEKSGIISLLSKGNFNKVLFELNYVTEPLQPEKYRELFELILSNTEILTGVVFRHDYFDNFCRTFLATNAEFLGTSKYAEITAIMRQNPTAVYIDFLYKFATRALHPTNYDITLPFIRIIKDSGIRFRDAEVSTKMDFYNYFDLGKVEIALDIYEIFHFPISFAGCKTTEGLLAFLESGVEEVELHQVMEIVNPELKFEICKLVIEGKIPHIIVQGENLRDRVISLVLQLTDHSDLHKKLLNIYFVNSADAASAYSDYLQKYPENYKPFLSFDFYF